MKNIIWMAGLMAMCLAQGARAQATPDRSLLGPEVSQGKIPVLLVKGMWSQHWRFNEILDAPAGMYGVTNSYVAQQDGYIFGVKYFPDTEDALMRQKVVILGNVPTTALYRQGTWTNMRPAPAGRTDQWLVDYVNQGGGLFVLGGSFSFDLESTARDPGRTPVQNTFKDSALAGILPVELGEKTLNFAEQSKPLALVAAGRSPILAGVDFAAIPITLFYHPMRVREGATVVITAGGHPILVLGTHGKGRIAVFLATLHGDPAKDLTPYWQWKSWPTLVRNTVNWLAAE